MTHYERLDAANARIAELEALFKINQRDIRDTVQQALGYEQTIDALGAVRRLADRYKELEARLAAAAEKKASVFKNERDFYEDKLRREMKDTARLRAALEKVEAWMSAVEVGPICSLWDDGIIGNYEYEDGGCIEWSETLSRVRDLNIPIEQLGTDAREHQLEEVMLYREILQALRPDEHPPESERE